MKNDRGEITLFAVMTLVVLSGLFLLCSLELQKSFSFMKKRTHLFLCAKETKGEFHHYMRNMGRTNWAIVNIHKAGLVMMFVPGLQGVAMNAQKLKKYLKHFQNTVLLFSYLEKLRQLRKKGCPLDPRLITTPFELSASLYKRGSNGAAILRKDEWSYYFLQRPYLIELKIKASHYQGITPKIEYIASEKRAKLFSLLPSVY